MAIVLAGLLAAGLSYVVNGLLAGRAGFWWLIAAGPGLEELLKTGGALFFGASIAGVHLFFGLVEALCDLAGGRRGRITAGLASIAGHGFFGFLAAVVYGHSQSMALAVIIPWGLHFFWNGSVFLFHRRFS